MISVSLDAAPAWTLIAATPVGGVLLTGVPGGWEVSVGPTASTGMAVTPVDGVFAASILTGDNVYGRPLKGLAGQVITGVYTSAGGGGGGGGDATAANQVITNTSIGATNETPAPTDTSISGLNGLIKRALAHLTAISDGVNTILPVLPVQPMMAAGAALTNLAFSEVIIAESTSGDRTIVAAVSGQTTKVYRMILQAGATGLTVLVKNGAGTTLLTIVLAANQGFVLDFSQYPWFTTSANTAFILNLSGSVALNGRLYYVTSV